MLWCYSHNIPSIHFFYKLERRRYKVYDPSQAILNRHYWDMMSLEISVRHRQPFFVICLNRLLWNGHNTLWNLMSLGISEFLASIDSLCTQFLLNTQDLVVFCQTLTAAWGTSLDLKCREIKSIKASKITKYAELKDDNSWTEYPDIENFSIENFSIYLWLSWIADLL